MMKSYFFMALFPILEVFLFVNGVILLENAPVLGVLSVVGAGLAMSFSLHITYHYHVHFRRKSKVLDRLIDFGYSILTGLPFNFYYLLHTNHHVYDNEIEDFTTTIIRKDGKIRGKNIFMYAFFWFKSNRKPLEMMQLGIKEDYFSKERMQKSKIELLVILLFEIMLGVLNWKLLLLYFALVYFGWLFISLHNYGQHLPNKKGIDIGNSYYNKLYNFIFVNNGLHYEHHKFPVKKYWDLEEEKEKNLNNKLPHIVDGFRYLMSRR